MLNRDVVDKDISASYCIEKHLELGMKFEIDRDIKEAKKAE